VATSVDIAGQTSVKSEPNVIPMIDIMLVLLIIFMIVTPLITSGFQAVMPRGVNLDPRPEEDNEQVLGIDANGAYYQNTRAIEPAVLEEQLRSIYSARTTDKILYFKADQGLKYATVQEAVEIARRAGVRVMSAITEREQTGGLFAGDDDEGGE